MHKAGTTHVLKSPAARKEAAEKDLMHDVDRLEELEKKGKAHADMGDKAPQRTKAELKSDREKEAEIHRLLPALKEKQDKVEHLRQAWRQLPESHRP